MTDFTLFIKQKLKGTNNLIELFIKYFEQILIFHSNYKILFFSFLKKIRV